MYCRVNNNDLIANNTGTTGWLSTAENIVKGGLATGGVVTASAFFSVTMTAVLQALPMVQAILLLGMYALLPLVVVLSRYSIAMMVIGFMIAWPLGLAMLAYITPLIAAISMPISSLLVIGNAARIRTLFRGKK
mgnify:CR=1 FL=1